MRSVARTHVQVPKRRKPQAPAPRACFLHSATRVGSKIVVVGGSDYYGSAIDQLLVYDTDTFAWSRPPTSSSSGSEFGAKYGHSATLIDMHPPRLMFFGGMATTAGVFTFEVSGGGGKAVWYRRLAQSVDHKASYFVFSFCRVSRRMEARMQARGRRTP